MKCRSFRFVCAVMTAILVFVSGIAVTAYTAEYDAAALGRQILELKMDSADAHDEQSFIDGWLTENAGSGTPDWYAICLAKEYRYDFSAYTTALEAKINEDVPKATDRLRMALAYNAAGGSDLDIGAVIDESWNGLGIMSEIYSLILLNSGDFSCSVDDDTIVAAILNRQQSDGGWALSGRYSDPDVTAMALQALSAYRSNPGIMSRIDKALELLSDMQQPEGGYKSYGVYNSESCAQVILALCQLEIDPLTDSRFIKNGNSPVDALMSFRCESGSFSHISGGKDNDIAAIEAYEAFTALSHSRLYELKEAEFSSELPGLPTDETINDAVTPTEEAAENITATQPPHTEVLPGNIHTSVNQSDAITSVTAGEEAAFEEKTQASEEVSAEEKITAEKTTVTSCQPSETSKTETVTSAAVTATSGTAEESSENTAELTSVEASAVVTSVSVISGTNEKSGGDGWKVIAYIVIAGAFAFSQVYLLARKQFSWKRFVVSLAACAVCSGAVFAVRIQSPEEYYSRNISDIQPDSLTVTLSVSCETIADEIGGDYLIVPATELVLLEGDTVFDILERTLAYNKIPFDYTGSTEADIYVRGIGGIYEMDYGEMSGWMYRVNGEFPDVGCGAYQLRDGDVIEWLYTREIGRDLELEES